MNRVIARLMMTALLGLAMTTAVAESDTRLLMKTSLGDIELSLDAEKAPRTVANFLRYVDEGFYVGTIFHRVISGFMIQGGGFTVDLDRKQTHEPVRNEANNGLKNSRGAIAMARTNAPHSATAQFFINHADNGNLDYPGSDGWGYAVFGRVTRGMEVVDKIADVYTTSTNGMRNVPEQAIVIESVERIVNSN
ncbi:MAG: peptidyl-prolyl cis-trans isomerase [Gammaproteobacteria bacterium]|nr:peptidyl-prolyl cis-trans isomerase [Gammaproteobacteria bacterium]